MTDVKTYYSVAELARLMLPGFPTSDRGVRDLAYREGWEFITVRSKGGKQGLRKDFRPSDRVLEAIRLKNAQPDSCIRAPSCTTPPAIYAQEAKSAEPDSFIKAPSSPVVSAQDARPAEAVKAVFMALVGFPRDVAARAMQFVLREIEPSASLPDAASTAGGGSSGFPHHEIPNFPISIKDLLLLQVPGFPRTVSGLIRMAKKRAWPFEEVHGRGGNRGMKRIYHPPSDVIERILQHVNGDAS